MPTLARNHPPAKSEAKSIRARAKVLARRDYEMRAALVHLRRREGLTQEQLANRMGITQQAVHKFERYDSDPKLSTIRRYANAVGALIKYDVTPDLGQSVRLAATSPWAAADSTSTIVQIERQQDSKSTPSGSWSETLSDTKPWAV